MNWMRRMSLVVSIFTILAVLAGCGGAKTEAPKPAPAPVVETKPAAPAPPPLDKAALLKDNAIGYFTSLPANSNMVEAADLKKKIDEKDASIVLVDIRKPEDYAKGALEGSVNIPMGQVGANIDKLPRDKQLVVICYSGQTSGQTVAALRMAGFNAISLKGGFPSIEKAGAAVKAGVASAALNTPAATLDEKQTALKEAAAAYFNNLPANSNMVEAADVKKKVDAKDNTIFLLDIRKPEDYKLGYVEGTLNIPMGQVGANLDKLPKDKQIIVNCYSGQTSGQTIAVLKLAGYNAVSVKGGFPSYQTAGFEVKK